MLPSQASQAGLDLQAKIIQPIHWAKFAESNHPWNEPVQLLLLAAKKLGIEVNVPLIGQPYTIGDPPKHTVWWEFE